MPVRRQPSEDGNGGGVVARHEVTVECHLELRLRVALGRLRVQAFDPRYHVRVELARFERIGLGDPLTAPGEDDDGGEGEGEAHITAMVVRLGIADGTLALNGAVRARQNK